MEIKHGNNFIWDMELTSYNKVFISDMHMDSYIIIEKQYGSEDLFPFITIKRISENEWEGIILFDYSGLPPEEQLAYEFESIRKVYPIYKFLSKGEEKQLGIEINENGSIEQVVNHILMCSDILYDDIIQRNYVNTRLFESYVNSKLPIYQRAVSRVKMELESFVTDDNDNMNKVVDICGRVKSMDSISEKINRKNIYKYQMFEKFDDIAGVRCTCEYLDDVYEVLEYIKENPLLRVIEIDDKIDNCTKEGYRGIHIIVFTKIYYKGILHENVKVEIQLRTSFQNAWSMKTHELTYKHNTEFEKKVVQEMKKLSDILYEADKVSMEMKKKIKAK